MSFASPSYGRLAEKPQGEVGTPRRTARSAPHPARSHGRSWRTCPARRCGRTCCSGCRDSTRFPLLFSSRNHCSAHPRQGGQDGKIEPEQCESPAFEEPEAAAMEARQNKGKLHDPAREAKRFIQGVQPVRLSSVRIVQRGENYSPEKPAAHYAYVLILPSCLIPEVPLFRLLARKRRLTSPSAPHAVPERDEAAFRSAQNARPGHTQSPPTPRTGPEQRRSPTRVEPGFAIALWQAHRGGTQALPSCREPSGRRERQARKGHPGRREPSGRRERRERSGRQARQGRRAWPGRQEARLRIRGTPCQKTGLSPRISGTSCRSRLLLV